MPKQIATRWQTNSIQNKQLCEEQEQHRHNHGLRTSCIYLRKCFQTKMISANCASQTIFKYISDLLRLLLVMADDQLLNKIKIRRAM